jgi:sulfur carrier protein ThiS
VNVRVKLIATYLAHLPPGTQGNTAVMDVPEGATIRDVLGPLGIPLDDTSVLLLNGLQAEADAQLSEGDTVTAFSAIAGGRGNGLPLATRIRG